MIINKTDLNVVSDYEFRQLHQNVSFPATLTNECLEGFDYTVITPPDYPSLTKYQTASLGNPYRHAGEIKVKWDVVESLPSLEILTKEYELAIDDYINSKAREYKYNDVYSMISYRGDPNPKFAQEAESMFVWRSAVWTKANQDVELYLTSLQTETPLPLPTIEDVISGLPEFILV